MNTVAIIEVDRLVPPMCLCTNRGRCPWIENLENLAFIPEDEPRSGEELAGERLRLMEAQLPLMQERGGYTAREARALLARDITEFDVENIEFLHETLQSNLANAWPGILRETLEYLCGEILTAAWAGSEEPAERGTPDERDLTLNDYMPTPLGDRIMKALREDQPEAAAWVYGDILRIVQAVQSINQYGTLRTLEGMALDAKQEFDHLAAQGDPLGLIERIRDEIGLETEIEARAAAQHLSEAASTLRFYHAHGGSCIEGMERHLRIGLTLATLHRHRGLWENPDFPPDFEPEVQLELQPAGSVATA